MDAASVSSMDATKTSADLWSTSTNSLSNSGWGTDNLTNITSNKSESGWGSPSPSPNPNAGTDSWGSKQVQPQAWGASTSNETATKMPTDWASSNDAKSVGSATASGSWNQGTSQAPSNWGDNESKSSDAGSWGSQADLTTQASVWGQSEPTSIITSTPSATSVTEGSVNATTAPRPISASWSGDSSATSQPNTNHPQGAWTGGSPFNKPHTAWPPGRPVNNEINAASEAELQKEKIIAAAVNTQDGWGAQPVRQDTDWSTEDTISQQPPPRRRNSSDEDHWIPPNTNGTAIWESKQESWARSHSRSSSTSSSGANDWTNEEAANWNGKQWNRGGQPPGHQWMNKAEAPNWDRSRQVPPDNSSWIDSNQPNLSQQRAIAGAGASANPTAGAANNTGTNQPQWRPKAEVPMWSANNDGKPPDDNMWDRDGTHVWGKTETGSWSKQRPLTGGNGQYWNEQGSANGGGSWDTPAPNIPGQRPPDSRFWPDGQPQPLTKKWPEDGPSGQWNPQQPPPTNSANSSTWVNPTPPQNPNISMDGTHIWKQKPVAQPVITPGANGPPNWAGDKMAPWPTAGAKPKQWGATPNSKTEGMQGWGEENDDHPTGDVGTWGDNSQDAAGWTSSSRDWKMDMPRPQNTSRTKLLQQLIELGFKKEDAQNALFKNDMNFESARAALMEEADKARLEGDMSNFSANSGGPFGSQPPGGLLNNLMPNSVPVGRPLAGANPSMQQQSQQPGSAFPRQPPIPSLSNAIPCNPPSTPNAQQSVQQQIIHQQIVQQLRAAVQAGLINPQLLNQRLSPAMLVTLQQLLQLQTVYQRLVTQEQVLKTNKSLTPAQKSQQLEQLTMLIGRTRQQILQSQCQITSAQQLLSPMKPGSDQVQIVKDLSNNMAALNMKKEPPSQPLPGQQSQQMKHLPNAAGGLVPGPRGPMNPPAPTPQNNPGNSTNDTSQPQKRSRLTQWKLPSPDKEAESINKAPGSKLPACSSNPLIDSTWTSSDASSWPTSITAASSTASTSTNLTTSQSDSKDSIKHTPTSSTIPVSINHNQSTPTTASSANIHASANSSTSGSSDIDKANQGDNSDNASTDDDKSIVSSINANVLDNIIVEFVPGKPWQGTNTKNPEDDPDITPGDFQQSWDAMIPTNLTGRSTAEDVWASGDAKPWSTSSDWKNGQNISKTRTPPGFNQNKPNFNQAMNRSVSWAPGDHRPNQTVGSHWAPGGGAAVLLRNTNQANQHVLSEFCNRYGTVQAMKDLGNGQLLVVYAAKESAMNAFKEISNTSIGEPRITAMYLSENEIPAVLKSSTTTAASTEGPSAISNPWSSTNFSDQSQWNGSNSTSSMFTTSTAWSAASGTHDEHSASDLLGGSSM